MKIEYSLLVLALALVYGVIVQFFPDFPISEEVLLAFVVWALTRLGVEISAPALRGALKRRGWLK
jgi:hypothetical protein